MNILITDSVDRILIDLLEQHNINYKYDNSIIADDVLQIIHRFDGIIIRNRLNLNKSFLNKVKGLKFIARYGSGMESIDLETAKQLKIKCFNSSSGNANSVAEHTTGLLLCLLHNINKSMKELHTHRWDREGNRGIELEGKTIAIIGYGTTGSLFAKKLMSFNCNIIAYDKYKFDYGNSIIKESNMNTIYNEADVISFHVPLNTETTHLLNKKFIAKMKKPFYLLNTSRGGVVSNNDLIHGLKEKQIIGAGLDVIENENKGFNDIKIDGNFNYLLNCDNVILTPHIAGLSKEANRKLSEVLIKKILELK